MQKIIKANFFIVIIGVFILLLSNKRSYADEKLQMCVEALASLSQSDVIVEKKLNKMILSGYRGWVMMSNNMANPKTNTNLSVEESLTNLEICHDYGLDKKAIKTIQSVWRYEKEEIEADYSSCEEFIFYLVYLIDKKHGNTEIAQRLGLNLGQMKGYVAELVKTIYVESNIVDKSYAQSIEKVKAKMNSLKDVSVKRTHLSLSTKIL